MSPSVPRMVRSSGQVARTTIGDGAVGAEHRRQIRRRCGPAHGWRGGWRASRRSRQRRRGPRPPASSRRGRRRGSAPRSAPPRARSARGRSAPRRRRRRARRGSAYRGCRGGRAAGPARRRRCRRERSPEWRRATSSPRVVGRDEGRLDLVERHRRGVDDARARAGTSRASPAARSSRHRGRPGSGAMRSRPRTVMRSAAPGPAPMKCTVTAWSRSTG